MTPTPEHNAPDTIWAWKWNCPGVRDNLKASWSNFKPYFDPWVTRGFPSLKFPLGVQEEHLTVATQYTRTDTIPTWQDISTAPRDGTHFLALWRQQSRDWESHHAILETRIDFFEDDEEDGDYLICAPREVAEWTDGHAPLYWMPLPPAPTEGADT